QRVLHGRMQESVAVRVPAARAVRAAAPTAPARAAAPELVVFGSALPAAKPPVTPGEPARARSFGRSFGRMVAYAAPLVAVAAAVPLWLAHHAEHEFQLALTLDRAPVTQRGAAAGVPRRG